VMSVYPTSFKSIKRSFTRRNNLTIEQRNVSSKPTNVLQNFST